MTRTVTLVATLAIIVACAVAFLVGRSVADDTPASLKAVAVRPLATPTVGPPIVLPPKAVVR